MRSLLLLTTAMVLLGASAPDERVIARGGLVNGSLNGLPLRLRVEPGAVAMPIVTEDAARRAELNAGPFDWSYQIGEQSVTGQSAVARIDFGTGRRERRRVGWTERPYASGFDAVVGPGMLREEVIRFDLGPARDGERTATLRMVGQGGMEEKWGERFALIQVGGEKLRVQFDPYQQRSTATANAGARIAAAHQGRLADDTHLLPIAYAIERPARTLRLGTPLEVGPLSLTSMSVRTNDFGSIRRIARDDGRAPGPSEPDPNEIVVSATVTKSSRYDQLTLGADVLQRCSRIVFDKERDEIRLTCN